jgi:hypothetical protein
MVGTTISHYRITEKLDEDEWVWFSRLKTRSSSVPQSVQFLAAYLLGDEGMKDRFGMGTPS